MKRLKHWVGPNIGPLQFVNLAAFGLNLIWSQTYYRLLLGRVGKLSVFFGVKFLGDGRRVYIGDGVIIRWNSRIEAVSRYAGVDLSPTLTIGDGTNIEQNVHIVCGERVSIGRNVTITANCAIVDVVHPYDNASNKIGLTPIRTLPVEIGEGSMLGIGTVVLPGTTIGQRVVVGANSVVRGVLPNNTIWAGAPAKQIGEY